MKAFSFLLGSFLSLVGQVEASAPLLQIEQDVKGNTQIIYIRPTTTFERSTILLDAKVDGKKVTLNHPDTGLWTYAVVEKSGTTHTLRLRVSLASAQKLLVVEQAIAAVSQKISDIQAALATATDPQVIAQLTAELNEEQNVKATLLANREALKNLIGKQDYVFTAN